MKRNRGLIEEAVFLGLLILAVIVVIAVWNL